MHFQRFVLSFWILKDLNFELEIGTRRGGVVDSLKEQSLKSDGK
jgi:hypothetical protein